MKRYHSTSIITMSLFCILFACESFTDFEPPLVKILHPLPNEIVYGDVEIAIESVDNHKLDRVELYLDSVLVYFSREGSIKYTWELTETQRNSKHVIVAKAFDSKNNMNEVRIDFFGYGKLPPAPKLKTPLNKSSIIYEKPFINWSNISSAQCYHLQVDNNSDFSSPFIDNVSVKTNHYAIALDLELNKKFFWRVRARYNWSEWGTWSESWSFTTNVYLWKFQTGGSVTSSPAIGIYRTIFAGSDDGCLYALNLDGTLKWKYQTSGAVKSSPAISSEGVIYVGSDDSYLYALSPDGHLIWRFKTGAFIRSSPAIDFPFAIYIGSADRRLYALNSKGRLKWSYQTAGWIQSSPAVDDDGSVYICSRNGDVYALTPAGKLKWEYKTEGLIDTSPAIDQTGAIYVVSVTKDRIYALNSDGTLKWKSNLCCSTSPIIGPDGIIYVSGSSNIYALNSDGSLKWNHSLLVQPTIPTIGSDGTIYLGSRYTDRNRAVNFFALHEDGRVKRSYFIGSTGYSAPAIGLHRVVYVGAVDGCIYALPGFSHGLADSPWPRCRRDNQNTGRSERF